jgi:hypothetical protein
VRQWATPLLAFAAITAWWLFPVLANLSTVIPGSGAGDNVTFVWNIWWMRYAVHHSGPTFFFTPFLFHPLGVDLTLHTHTALPALLGAAWRSPIAGQNALIALHIYLNLLCSYALAGRITGNVIASLAGAMIFGASAFVGAHLNGHFNLIAAWTLPLVCLLTLRAGERPSWSAGVFLGLALGAIAYIDYYLFVYAVITVFLLCISQAIRLGLKTEPYTASRLGLKTEPYTLKTEPDTVKTASGLLVALLSLLLLDALVIAAILLFPGDRVDIGSLHISLRSVRNPITVGWILLLAAAATVAYSRIRIATDSSAPRPPRRVLIAAAATTLVLLMPLAIHAVALWRSGAYVSQSYMWRSAPAGVDAATILLGNPFHAAWGESVRAVYNRLHVDVIEASAWIPVSAIAFAIAAIVLRRENHKTTPWVLTGTVFLVWALGPWLMVVGRQTPLILPSILLRFVPLVANARIPGRAMVVVSLSIALLAAMGLERLLNRGRAARMTAGCLLLLLVIECIPARPPLYVPAVPSTYFALNDRSKKGAVCELPLGLRDGFGETGSLDENALLYQTIHERPIVGGFVARLPPSIAREYAAMPVLGSLLQLSSGAKVSETDASRTPHEAAALLASAGIAFVILDTRRASADLIAYVQSQIELKRIAEEDGRVFYEVE